MAGEAHGICANRNVAIMTLLDDLSVADIAHIQQAPEGTVKTRLFHGRINLRQCIQRWFAQEGGRHG